jgi:hypothetical protein
MSLIPRLRASLSPVWPLLVVQMEEHDVWLMHNTDMHPTMIHMGRANVHCTPFGQLCHLTYAITCLVTGTTTRHIRCYLMELATLKITGRDMKTDMLKGTPA